MILQALNAYYERLRADPNADVVEPGYSRQKIAFRVVLRPDGSLVQIEDARKELGTGKRMVSSVQTVMGGAKPPGQGINPCFLWDNAAYMLGYVSEDQREEKGARAKQTFAAFRERHLSLRSEIDAEAFEAVCRFLETWNPEAAEASGMSAEYATGFGVFGIHGANRNLHEDPKIEAWWRSRLDADLGGDEPTMQCLVTGELRKVARTHEPKIKGVPGAQAAGAALASYNFDASESYGKEQNYNAPVSQEAAFRYAVALNYLLDPEQNRRFLIGDASVVYWTERPAPADVLFGFVMSPGDRSEDESLRGRLRSAIEALANGSFPEELGDPDVPFYVLGLSPNAARLSVRLWLVSTLGDVLESFQQHFEDLAIDRGPKDPEFPSVWRLARETGREAKDVSPLLAGALTRAVLQKLPYPSSFLAALLRRARIVDSRDASGPDSLNATRCGAIKACLNRDYRARPDSSPLTKELSVSLDPDRPESAYQLGRLFAVLERAQQDALGPGINATIKDRYFGAASSTPGSVFPRLIRMNQHHTSKIENEGRRINLEKRIGEICQRVDSFPAHLTMQQQGLFAIGYYHQRQDFFKPRSESDSASQENQG